MCIIALVLLFVSAPEISLRVRGLIESLLPFGQSTHVYAPLPIASTVLEGDLFLFRVTIHPVSASVVEGISTSIAFVN